MHLNRGWLEERPSRFEIHMHSIKEVKVNTRTRFQEVGIYNSHLRGEVLFLNGDMQSAQSDEYIYHESLVHPAAVLAEKCRDVLILGGGEGATLREVLKHNAIKRAVMVDIDGELVRMCKEHLTSWSDGAFDDPRTEVYFEDAGRWVEKTDSRFDVIIHDITDPRFGDRVMHLFSLPFFQKLKKIMNPGAMLAMQASRTDAAFMDVHCAVYNTLKRVFRHVRPYRVFVPSFYCAWGFMMASDRVDPKPLSPDYIDGIINNKINGRLDYYDGETHRGMFSLPLPTRRALSSHDRIIKSKETTFDNEIEFDPEARKT